MRPSQRNADLADNGTARAGKVIGTDVYNDQNQKIGSIDDVLIGKDNVWAVISTDKQKVVVPFKNFIFGDAKQVTHDKPGPPDTTQAKLDTMPKFDYDASSYASKRRATPGNGTAQLGNRTAPGAPVAPPAGTNTGTNQPNNAKTNG